MKIKEIIFLCLALFLCSGVAFGETVDRIVANVNGEIILYSDIQNRIRSMEKLKKANPGIAPEAISEREVLQQLIREKLAEAEIKRLKITVSDGEVDSAIQNLKAEHHVTDAQFEEALRQEGETLKSFRNTVKKQIEQSRLMDRVLKSKIVITDEQVNAYVRTAPPPTVPTRESLRISVIFLPSGDDGKQAQAAQKQAKEIHNRLKGGSDFGRMAREYSKGPASEEGGDVGFVELGDLAPPIAAAVRKLKKNDFSEPVVTPAGVYIVKLLDVRTERPDPGEMDNKERIRRELYQKEVNRQYENWMKELESRSFIQITL
ncbi:MAG TPA: peptidylprolyl isomerase [Syntrophobacteraceae bacterium]|nr:peptidylprolyl isomerase [Syntrophobacteraceae bacterium]